MENWFLTPKFDVVYPQYIRNHHLRSPEMKAAKTETITVRIEPAVKAGLKVMAERERRSIANMIDVMIRDYCGRNAVKIDDSTSDPSSVTGNRHNKNEG